MKILLICFPIVTMFMKSSFQRAQMVQENLFQLIPSKQGKLCSNGFTGSHYVTSLASCAALIGTDFPHIGSTVFTFDSKTLTCRTYLEDDFNNCSFETCDSCKSYKYENLELVDNSETTTTELNPQVNSSTTLYEPEVSTTTHNTTAISFIDELSTNTEPSTENSYSSFREPDINTISGPDSTETSSSIITGEPETTTQTSTEFPEVNLTAMTTQANAVSCDGRHGTTYPHPTDCSQYIECVNSEVIERQCSLGLHFNANLNVCDFPESAGCQS